MAPTISKTDPHGGRRVARIYSLTRRWLGARDSVWFCPCSVIASVNDSEPKQSILFLDKMDCFSRLIAVRAMTSAIFLLDSGVRRNDNDARSG